MSIDKGTSPSDFEVALGRAGIDLAAAAADGSFQIGSPESSPPSDSDITFKFPSHVQSTAESTRFLSVDPQEEEIMKKAAVTDLSRIFGLTVSSLTIHHYFVAKCWMSQKALS